MKIMVDWTVWYFACWKVCLMLVYIFNGSWRGCLEIDRHLMCHVNMFSDVYIITLVTGISV